MTTILHAPFGQEHPYEQLPEERFPRQPLACEPFVVGIVTRPVGAATAVRVHQWLDGVLQPVIDVQPLSAWRPELEEGVGAEFLERIVKIDQDVWRANLTAPPAGQTLTYQLEADGVMGDRFELRGEQWQTGGGCSFTDDRMAISQQGGSCAGLTPDLLQVDWLTDGQHARRVRLTFAAGADEGFFGLGERFNALNQRGEVMDIRCYEQYKNQGKRTYMPIPFLLSSAGYGLLVESSRWMQFDLAASAPDRWTLEADLGPDETLSLKWFKSDDPVDIIGQFTCSTGPAVLPPLWAFGLWMSGNEWNTQARVMQEVETSLAEQIEPSVLVIEAWSDETTFYIFNDAQYISKAGGDHFSYGDFSFPADGKWPNPKEMVDWLHERGVRVLLWQVPAFKLLENDHPQHTADHAHFEARGLGIHDADGSLHRIKPFWFRGGYIWDVTNPEARDWWLGKREYLLRDIGIDGFKTDGGEHLWGASTVFGDGRTGAELWNEYPQLYSEAYYQFANQQRESIVFSRAGFIGSQRAPLHWAGDENSTWDAFRHSIYAGLSAGISGIPFWGWDFAGFSGEIPTAELYMRGTAMAVFCPVMQYHSEFNQHRENRDRTPWNIQARTGDERVLPTFRYWANLRHNLLPYIWQEAQHSAATGEPMMRAARLYDTRAGEFDYFFGRDLFVAPVVEEGAAGRSVYLPAGQWADLWTREVFAGDQTIAVNVPFDRLPVFVRAGAQLPLHLGAKGELGEHVSLSGEANTVWEF